MPDVEAGVEGVEAAGVEGAEGVEATGVEGAAGTSTEPPLTGAEGDAGAEGVVEAGVEAAGVEAAGAPGAPATFWGVPPGPLFMI